MVEFHITYYAISKRLYPAFSDFTRSFCSKIKIAHQKDYYPYSWVNEKGQAEGILIDWWKLWGQKTDTEVEFIHGSTKECINMVINDKADIIAGLFFQEALSDSLSYSEYLMRAKTVLYLRKDIHPESSSCIRK